jgi:hypothetical protein
MTMRLLMTPFRSLAKAFSPSSLRYFDRCIAIGGK